MDRRNKRLLTRASYRYIFKHPWQAILSIIGIVLGIAVIVSVDLANQSASNAFKISMNEITGNATHHIIGGPAGIPDSVYTFIRSNIKIRNSAPVVERTVKIKKGNETMSLLGVDLFAEKPFRDFSFNITQSASSPLSILMTMEKSAMVSNQKAESLELAEGDSIEISFGGISKKILIAATFDSKNSLSADDIIITDIATAQEVLDQIGRINRIDLIIPEDSLHYIADFLGEDLEIISSETRSNVSTQMLDAFNLNLTAMSLLALIVGMFIIYNTMTFSVVQRKQLIGLLRSLGTTRREILFLILKEALILGIIGTLLGIAAGVLLGTSLIGLITRTINDLYFVVKVKEIDIEVLSIVKAVLIGLVATMAATLKPAFEAAGTKPLLVIRRSFQEQSIKASIPRFSILGAIFIGAGSLSLLLPIKSIIVSYIGILPVIIGFALLTPLIIIATTRFFSLPMKWLFGNLGKMASNGVSDQLSRTSVSIAALGLAVAATIGVGTMISSFRTTVVHWLENRLEADLYISPPSLISRKNDSVLRSEFVDSIKNIKSVESYNYYREIEIFDDDGVQTIIGASIAPPSYGSFLFKEKVNDAWDIFYNDNTVFLTEPYAYRKSLEVGDTILLNTDKGSVDFLVAGIYYDYTSEKGLITMSFDNLSRYWNINGISGISIFVEDQNTVSLKEKIRDFAGSDETVLIRSNKELRDISIDIFDRTFIVARLLQILAVIVAFIGILSAFMAIQLERKKELGTLRAVGFTSRQIWGLTTLQSTVMGFISGILSIPLGNLLAAILIFIINKRSFGWTLQFDFLPEGIHQSIILAVVASILAGIYPAIKMAKISPAVALKEE